MKERNSTEFISMSQVAGATDPRGTGVAGGVFSWGPFRLGAVEYYTQDTINIAYAESKIRRAAGAPYQRGAVGADCRSDAAPALIC